MPLTSPLIDQAITLTDQRLSVPLPKPGFEDLSLAVGRARAGIFPDGLLSLGTARGSAPAACSAENPFASPRLQALLKIASGDIKKVAGRASVSYVAKHGIFLKEVSRAFYREL